MGPALVTQTTSYPVNATNGQLWFEPNSGTLSYYYEDENVWIGIGKGRSGDRGPLGYTGSLGYWGSVGYTGSQGITGYFGSVGYVGSMGIFDTQTEYNFQNTITMSANLVVNNVTIGTSFEILNFSEVVKNHGSVATSTLNLYVANGNIQTMTLAAATVTLSLSTTGMKANRSYSIALFVTQDGAGNRNLVFPANVKWQGGYTPTFTKTALYTDIMSLVTVDAGTNWYATYSGKGYV